MGRIWNAFDAEDLDAIAQASPEESDLLRLYDRSLIERLVQVGLDHLAIIISHTIDLATSGIPDYSAGVAVEVASQEDLEVANGLSGITVIGKSFESPGPCKELSAFLLLQMLKSDCRHPFYMQGDTGYALFQAYLASGVAGVVLSGNQFEQAQREKTIRFTLSDNAIIRLALPGGTPEAIAVREQQVQAPESFLKTSYTKGQWLSGGSDLWSAEHREQTLEYLRLYDRSPRDIDIPSSFYAGSPSTVETGCRYPIFQGAMANITRTSEFAQVVAEAGGLPCLALAGIAVDEAIELVRETAALNFPYAAGIVGLSLSDQQLEQLIETFEQLQPTYLIVSAPQLDHVNRLLRSSLKLAFHAPNRAMFRVLYDMGCRTFIIEGEEAGGHTSNVGGLTAWQGVLDEIVEHNLQDKVHLIFAGGIKDRRAAELLSALIYFYGLERDLKVSLQMGTAYLCTTEATALTPLPESYRQVVIDGHETIITGESVHRNVRQVVTPESFNMLDQEWSIFSSEMELDDKKRAYEKLYQGGLRLAVQSSSFEPAGSYMAGAVCTLLNEQLSVEALHEGLIQQPSTATVDEHESIAIVGIGSILPGSKSVEEHFNNILFKRCFITDIPVSLWERDVYLAADDSECDTTYSGIAGLPDEIDSDLTDFRIPPSVSDEMTQLQILVLRCAQQALRDAGYFRRPFLKKRVGVVIGAPKNESLELNDKLSWKKARQRLEALAKKGDFDQEAALALLDEYEEQFNTYEVKADTVLGANGNLGVSRVASAFDFQGITNSVDAACSSSLTAIGQAVMLLQERRCDVVLSGGVDTTVHPSIFVGFSRLQALSNNGSFPFDERADGFVIGSGGAIFVLKRFSDAVRNGDEIYALIRGWGVSNDGAGKGMAAPDYEGQMRAVEGAYADAGIDPDEVSFVECHATGTPVGDAEERKSVSEYFGKPRLNSKKAPVAIAGSKAMVGHARAGAGAAGMLSSIFAINTRCVPPQVNYEQAPEGIDYAAIGLHVAKRPEPIDRDEIVTGTSSFGFGGINYHLVLSSSPVNQRAPVVDISRADFPLFDNLDNDLAFIFPGQGSQYVGMLHAFKHLPEVGELLHKADQIYASIGGGPLTPLLTELPHEDESRRSEQEERLRSTEVSQPAIFLLSAVILELVRARTNISPSLVIGHSLGEYSALYTAGVLSFEDAFTLVCWRGRIMGESNSKSSEAMIALECTEQRAEGMIEAVDGYATCANVNSYRQTVVSGESGAIDQLERLAEQQGMRAAKLNVARAFHSALVADCVAPIKAHLEKAHFNASRIAIPACLSRELFPGQSDIGGVMREDDRLTTIDMLCRQVDHPVDFVSQVNAAYESGIRRFVEVGPRNILSRLVEQIIENRPLQTECLNGPDGETLQHIEGLEQLLAEPVVIKRQPPPARQSTRKRVKASAGVATTSREMSLLERITVTVSSVSGYSVESINREAEFERDLGIDTLKIFEILSMLRGDVLPQEIENFRQLTSVQKILTVAEKCAQQLGGEEGTKSSSEISRYKYKTVETGRIAIDRTRQLSDGYGVDLPEAPYDGERSRVVIARPLPTSMSVAADSVIPELRNRIVEMAAREDGGRPEQIVVVTWCDAESFYDGAYLAIDGMLKVAGHDIASLEFSYIHIDAESFDESMVESMLQPHSTLPSSGKHLTTSGAVYQGRLFEVEALLGSELELSTQLTAEDVVLVTGGARGIAAYIVQQLLETTAARFVLIGRKQESEAWIAEQPERICYLSADLTDRSAIRSLNLGGMGISLIVHAAGIEIAHNILKASDEDFRRVIATKTTAIDEILDQLECERLRGVVQFSSIASYAGRHGQSDYAAANGLLNGRLKKGVPALSIAWPAWGEIGMASRGVIKEILETSGVAFLAPEEGLSIFVDLLNGFLANPPHGETIRFAASGAKISPYMVSFSGESENDSVQQLNSYRISDPDRRLHATLKLDLQRTPSLRDHLFWKEVYIPGALMVKEAARLVALNLPDEASAPVELVAVDFLSPIAVRDGDQVQLQMSRTQDTFLVELQEEHLRPIFNVTLKRQQNASEVTAADQKQLAEVVRRAGIELQPFGDYRVDLKLNNETRHKGYFALVDRFSYNGDLITANVDVALGRDERSLLSDDGGVAFLLEAAFQAGTLWREMKVSNRRILMPKHIGACRIYYHNCRKAESVTIFCELIEIEPESDVIRSNLYVVDQDNEPLMVMEDFHSSPIAMKNPLPVHTHPLYVPYMLNGCDLLAIPLAEAADYASAHRDMVIARDEEQEIAPLTAEKRQHEKLAGKLTTKLLIDELMAKRGNPRVDSLASVSVLSDGTPVTVCCDALQGEHHFSISHSDDLVCAAHAEVPVGIDVERIRTLSPRVVADICGEKTLTDIQRFIDETGYSAKSIDYINLTLPVVIFSQKEAVLKAAGIGIGEGLAEVEISDVEIQAPVRANYRGAEYELLTTIHHDHVISVARLIAGIPSVTADASVAPAIEREVPLSSLQQAVLYQESLITERDAPSYALALRIDLKVQLDRDALRFAIDTIVDRHDVLRMVFDTTQDQPTGQILRFVTPLIDEIDVEGGDAAEPEKVLNDALDRHSEQQFDLTRGPLFKINLLRLNQQRYVLQSIFHHSIMDCFSAITLANELISIYQGRVSGDQYVATASTSYSDFTERERALLSRERIERLDRYWHSAMSGVVSDGLSLPRAGSHSETEQAAPHYIDYSFHPEMKKQLEQVCRKAGVTLFAGLLALLQSAISKASGRNQSVIYIPFSGRDFKLDKESTGPFIRLLPIRADIGEGESYVELLQSQRGAILDAIEFSAIPPANLRQIVREQTEVGGKEPQVICQLIYENEEQPKLDSLEVESSVRDGVNPHAAIIASFFHSREKLRCTVTFNSALIDRATLQQVMSGFASESTRLCRQASQVVDPRVHTPLPAVATESVLQAERLCGDAPQLDSGLLNRDQVVDQVVVIWQFALKNDYGMKSDVNFFDAGGSSLQAVEIVANIKQTFGVELPLSSFVSAPTPAQQADLILSEEWRGDWNTAVALKASGDKPPFFCVHPSDGNVLCYSELASAMGEAYPFYGLQAKGLNGDDLPHQSFEEMASHYIEAMRELSPDGPYVIGGWSAGGIVAFEMGRQLKEQGVDAKLVLIDTLFPGVKSNGSDGDTAVDADSKVREQLLSEDQPELPENYSQAGTLREISAKASAHYRIGTYPGDISLMMSEDHDTSKQYLLKSLKQGISERNLKKTNHFSNSIEAWTVHHPLNWQHHARGRFEIYSVPGLHHSMMHKEHAPALAHQIMRVVDEAMR
ncbi:hypothetical protein BOW53_12855 [Solemya pervernicosa gill symbiont]|uniref:Uncharacterized protein n=1 Tax=Solemya pervernicosa gill symbiont TaxID=642797 RepID=A0A1T2L207_9GAMM|nr:hypothetical protein BOW53_12855 [Solemya pervernicosa gill symbiont]